MSFIQKFPLRAAFPRRSSALECSAPSRRNFSVAASPVSRVIQETHFAGLTPAARGKVRDIYDLGDKLLIVATDRLSAFDVVLPTPIPDKGRVLTQLSLFWFDLLNDVIPITYSAPRISLPRSMSIATISPADPWSCARRNLFPSSA